MKILVTLPKNKVRDTFFTKKQVAELEAIGEVVWNEKAEHMEDDELKAALKDVDVVFTGWGTHKLTGEIIEGADKLKLVAHVGGTVKPYVSEELYQKGILVASGNEIYADSVAEGCIAYLLCVLRKLPYYSGNLAKGIWPAEDQKINRGLIGRSVGLVGFGSISKKVIPLFKMFNMQIYVYSRYISDEALKKYGIEYRSVEDIFKTCDIVSLHSSYTPSTHHMIKGSHIESMVEGGILLNTSRGPIIDEQEMVAALKKRPDIIAALDVYESEPLVPGTPILECKNTFLMPHMGGPTTDMRAVVTSALIRDAVAVVERGEKPFYEIDWETCKKQTAD